MILRSIRVESWRCFAASVEVGPFIDGLNIIYGPNGIGKSTLMMALVRGLFDSHNVGGAAIKSLRPWGRSLAPKVTIEFEREGEQFQLHKQFINSPTARLQRRENGQYVPVAEGRAADNKAREILSGETPGRGASDQRHWGLAQILWVPQGNLRIEQLAPGTRATIQDELGAQIAGPGTEALEKRIADLHGQFFTPKGKLKSGASAPRIIGLESQLDDARAKRKSLRTRLDEFDSASRHIEDLQRQAQAARHSEQELDARLKETQQQVRVYTQLVARKTLHQQEMSAAEDRYRNLHARIQSICTTEEERKATAQELKQLQDDLPVQAKLVGQCRNEAHLAEQHVKEVRGRRKDVTAARQLAQLARRYTDTDKLLVALDKQLTQLEAAQGETQRLCQLREQIIAPDKKALAKITKIARLRDDARLQLDAALITVTIQPETQTQIEITVAEQTGTQTLTEDDTHEVKGAPEVAFRIPGVGRFRATGPTGDFDELRRQWESAVAQFDELTAGFGTGDLAALEKLRAEADELDTQISKAQIIVDTLVDGDNIDDLRRSRAHAAHTLDEILNERPKWKDTPPDPAGILQQADAIETQFTNAIDQAEAANDRVQKALQLELQKKSRREDQISNMDARAGAIARRLESLRNDGLDDKQRRDQLTQIAMQRDTAQGKLAEVNTEIEELGDDPSKLLAVLEGQLNGFRAEAANADRKLNIESGRLEQIISEAPYSELANVEEEIDRLEKEIARQQLEINAIRLLHETITEQKRNALQSILGPIRVRADHFLQRIAGTRFDSIQFDQSMLPQGISPKSVDAPVPLDQISGGEREQVHFAVRMALADVTCNNERQLVVLDDVFTYTDTSRLARIATILDETADRFQIVLLTCHPERYRGLSKAKFFDLEAITTRED